MLLVLSLNQKTFFHLFSNHISLPILLFRIWGEIICIKPLNSEILAFQKLKLMSPRLRCVKSKMLFVVVHEKKACTFLLCEGKIYDTKMMRFKQSMLPSVKVTLRHRAAGWEDFMLLEDLKTRKIQ